MYLEFIETDVFTRRIEAILKDDEYSFLQADIIRRPSAGKLIPGGQGLRKLRWRADSRGQGKRGGTRVIYYWYGSEKKIYMIYAFEKSEQADLTSSQLKTLSQYVKGGVL